MLEAVFIINTKLFAYIFTSDLPSSGADTLSLPCNHTVGLMLFYMHYWWPEGSCEHNSRRYDLLTLHL